jgi:hypothetical protein
MRNKVLIIFLLTFSSVVDIVVLIMKDNGSLGMFQIFVVWGLVFILQDAFKWFRVIVFNVCGIIAIYQLVRLLITIDILNLKYFIEQQIFVSSVVPLYTAISLIGLLTFFFIRNYDISR